MDLFDDILELEVLEDFAGNGRNRRNRGFGADPLLELAELEMLDGNGSGFGDDLLVDEMLLGF